MENITFRLLCAFRVYDSVTGAEIKNYSIECDPCIKRVNKDNGTVVLFYVPRGESSVSKEVSLHCDGYQTYSFDCRDEALQGETLRIQLVPENTAERFNPDTDKKDMTGKEH